jgi:ribonuclease G
LERQILVSAEPHETRAAILEDGRLAEFLTERPNRERLVGNIYKGRVQNVLPGMDAAFVDIGLDRNAFLYAKDVRPWLLDAGEEHDGETPGQHIKDLVRPGQEVLVQIVKDPVGTKGARVTTYLGLAGRYLVFTPHNDFVGVSRRITEDGERARLRQWAQEAPRPPGTGLIVRTVAEGADEAALAQDLEYLTRLWQRVRRRAEEVPAPALLHKDPPLTLRLVRDFFTGDVARFVIDNRAELERLREFVAEMAPDLKGKIRLFRGQDLFATYGVKADIERAFRRKVWLKSGGSIVIDRAEALVAIDVNTGKYTGKDSLRETILRTNLEAAEEIARQIRLRDLAGIIVVDFIDMPAEEDRRKVLDALAAAVARDRTRVHIVGISKLGLVEMTRKRIGYGIDDVYFAPCPTCDGRGMVLTDESVALALRREIVREAKRKPEEAFLYELHPVIAAILIGSGGAGLKELEAETGKLVMLRGNASLRREEHRLVASGTRASVEEAARPVRPGQRLTVRIEGPHQTHEANGIARVEGYVLDVEGARALEGREVLVEVTETYRTYAKARLVERS